MIMRVVMLMVVIMVMAMAVVLRCRHINDVAMPDAPLGDDMVSEGLHLRAAAFEHGDLKAALVIEMHVERGLRQIMVVVEALRQALGQLAGVMVVDIDQRRNAVA